MPTVTPDLAGDRQVVLSEIEQRVLWLATAIVDHANRVRPNPTGLKVGGHQASTASMTTLMTALYFEHLQAGDRVSVKPHASPVLHAISYLLGELDERYLTTLRAFGGLQSYPSRAKDPDTVDYSTGSVGIGATAPIWGALARRYVDGHLGSTGSGRQYSLVGDAELDEGAVWEAILDPMVAELGEVCWIVDLNRQSLDRVVPNIGATRLQGMFAAAGWQVLTVKYGRLLEELFTRPGGAALRRRIDEMPNPEYQRLLRCNAAQLRERLPGTGEDAAPIGELLTSLEDDALQAAIRNLGGHDLQAIGEAFAAIDDTRPTVIFAYTVKGYGLATEGHPQNHSSLLTAEQMARLAARCGMSLDSPWRRFDPASPAGAVCAAAARRLARDAVASHPVPSIPTDIGRTPGGKATTQAALGRALLDLSRSAPEAAKRIVTLCPDVSSSTNLGGWVNKVGVWSARERVDWFADDPETILHWREQPGRPAPGARDRRDEPRGAARRTRCDVVAVGSAAAADRCALRPVRRTGPGAVVVRGLRGRAVHPGRNAVRGHARPGGRRPPVHHHAVGGAGATRLPHLRARLRDRHGVGAAGLLGAPGAARRHLGVPAPVHPAGGPGAGRGPDRCRRA